MRPRTAGTSGQTRSPASRSSDPEAPEGQWFHQGHWANQCSEGLSCSMGGPHVCTSIHALPLTSCDPVRFL